jgi:tyrosinase
MTRIREDVWTLTREEGDWPAVLVAYDRAVGLLRQRDPATGPPSDPLGWRFLAAIHGIRAADGTADTSDPLWSNCQHGSWYFLAWHRMYLRAFELIVQDALKDADWSLPYWYAIDPDDADKSILPPAFRDSSGNLFTDRRSIPANGGDPLPDLGQFLVDALIADTFSTPAGTSTFGGGERSTPSFDGEERGLLEDVPHGAVHSLVGNDYDADGNPVRRGWMGSFYTAGLDPVFWLHHANIDRLWQVWLDLDRDNRNPTDDTAWLDAKFSFPKVGGGVHTWSIGDVLDTEAIGYRYASTAAPSAVAPPVSAPPDIGLAEVTVPEPIPPQVIGSAVDVPLATSEAIDVALSEPADIGLGVGDDEGAVTGNRVFLRIEGVTGTAAAPVYEIYLNVPPGDAPSDHPELRAGGFSTFGLVESSTSDDLHVGSGLTTVYDVTRVRDVLAQQGRWDPARLQVTFSPVTPVATVEGADLDEAVEVRRADLRAGQIALAVG